MPLTALPVTASELQTLQSGLTFTTNPNEASSEAQSINAPGSTDSVFIYASKLIQGSISTSSVAMAVGALMEGGTLAVTGASNSLTSLSTQFLPGQVQVAIANNFNPTVFAAESLGSALSTQASFQTFVGQNATTFSQNVSNLTGVGAGFIQTFVNNWTTFFTNNPIALQGRTVQQAAYGAAFGDAVGVALLNPTPANLQSVFSTTASNGFSPNTVAGLVANALIDVAEGTYVAGVALGALPQHAPLQGEFTGKSGQTVDLTVNKDTVTLNQSNSVVNGTFGGAGQTWTPGDTITGATGTTGQVFNITGVGTLGTIDVTSVGPGLNKVSGVQTVNITASNVLGAVPAQAVQGDFTATGPEGEWTGLTALNVQSGGNPTGADLLTVGAAVVLTIQDTNVLGTTAPLTVNGSKTTTITEANFAPNAGINVNGGSGTTTVKITQTQPNGTQDDGIVKILDAKGASTTDAGTITSVTLDGLAHGFGAAFPGFPPGKVGTAGVLNTITDNALTSLTINHSDAFNDGAALSIINNLTTPTATTLTLNLLADGVNATGFAATPNTGLYLVDAKNEISTIHLSLGAQNSFLHLVDNGLRTLDTTAGTGALVGTGPALGGGFSTISDTGAGATTIDLSGLAGPNHVQIDRGSGVNNDVFTLGNFGTNNTQGGGTNATQQQLSIFNTNVNNTDTIRFGSGAYDIFDAAHGATINPHHYVNTAPDGAGLISGFPTTSQWAEIHNARAAPVVGDTMQFLGDTVQNTFNIGAVGSVAAGIAAGLGNAQHSATVFNLGGNTYIFDHAGTSAISVAAADSLVEFVGIVFNAAATQPGGILLLA
jgi:hypothetical protein